MPRVPQKDKLTSIREQMRQLAAQEAALVARQKDQERKDDTRRKVIAGALALEHLATNPQSEFAQVLGRLLDEYVKRPGDRALFPTLPPEKPDAENGASASFVPQFQPPAFSETGAE